MKVKIGNTWYDAENQPLCVEFTEHELDYIRHSMDKDARKFAAAPNECFPNSDDLRRWLNDEIMLLNGTPFETPEGFQVKKKIQELSKAATEVAKEDLDFIAALAHRLNKEGFEHPVHSGNRPIAEVHTDPYGWYVQEDDRVIKGGFDSRKDAIEWAQSNGYCVQLRT